MIQKKTCFCPCLDRAGILGPCLGAHQSTQQRLGAGWPTALSTRALIRLLYCPHVLGYAHGLQIVYVVVPFVLVDVVNLELP